MQQKIEVSYKRAREIAHAAINLKTKRVYPFNLTNLFPDAVIPHGIQRGSLEHHLYLTHSISIDSMRQASEVYRAMQALTAQLPLDELHLAGKEKLVEILSPFFGEKALREGKSSMTDPIKTLMHNSKLIADLYQSDSRKLCPPHKEATDRVVWRTIDSIDDLWQYDIPKAALLLKNSVRFGIWDLPPDRIPIKIDRHLLRISLGAGVIDAERYARVVDWSHTSKALKTAREQLTRIGHFTDQDFQDGNVRVLRVNPKIIHALTQVYLEVCKREGISAIELDDAKWAIGAYGCKQNDARYCIGNCGIGCKSRFPSDNNACYFFIDVDKRKHARNLFS